MGRVRLCYPGQEAVSYGRERRDEGKSSNETISYSIITGYLCGTEIYAFWPERATFFDSLELVEGQTEEEHDEEVVCVPEHLKVGPPKEKEKDDIPGP